MKNKVLIILLLAIAPYCYSSTEAPTSFTFNYKFYGETYPVVIAKASYDDALEEAATQCFNHFAKSKGEDKVNLPQEVALDLIDECTNPTKH